MPPIAEARVRVHEAAQDARDTAAIAWHGLVRAAALRRADIHAQGAAAAADRADFHEHIHEVVNIDPKANPPVDKGVLKPEDMSRGERRRAARAIARAAVRAADTETASKRAKMDRTGQVHPSRRDIRTLRKEQKTALIAGNPATQPMPVTFSEATRGAKHSEHQKEIAKEKSDRDKLRYKQREQRDRNTAAGLQARAQAATTQAQERDIEIARIRLDKAARKAARAAARI